MALPSLAQREALLAEELGRRGFNPAQKAAILGSIRQESSLNPWAKEAGGTGVGLFQWSYGRAANVPKFTGDYATDVRNQLDLFQKELGGSEKKAAQLLESATDVPSAMAGVKQYLRYGEPGRRYDYAKAYAERLSTGELKPQAMATGAAGSASPQLLELLESAKLNPAALPAGSGAGAEAPAGLDLAAALTNGLALRGVASNRRSGDALAEALMNAAPRLEQETPLISGTQLVNALASGLGSQPAGATRMSGGSGVIEYLTGDKSHSGYRDDHGGSNYHEHLAFSTREQRDAAMAKLKAAGIQIGSVNDGEHAPNSYHYKDLAFDVPAAQVPVGKEQELSRRVRAILGMG